MALASQEDAHLIEPAVGNDNSVGFFAVFDGHGGKEVAGFAALYLVPFPIVVLGCQIWRLIGGLLHMLHGKAFCHGYVSNF